jgi:hypothetical protein
MTTREIFRNAHRARWEWTRRLGIYRYILLYGLLGWGLPMFLLMTFFVSQPPQSIPSTRVVLLSACLWLLGGIWFGWMTWRSSERKYKEILGGDENAEV